MWVTYTHVHSRTRIHMHTHMHTHVYMHVHAHAHAHTCAHSKVFLCRRRTDKSLIVIKQIPVDELQSEERKAAKNEVNVLKVMKHPNIIAYHDSFVEEKSLMIVMEYAPGGTLFDFIQEREGVLMEEEVPPARPIVCNTIGRFNLGMNTVTLGQSVSNDLRLGSPTCGETNPQYYPILRSMSCDF